MLSTKFNHFLTNTSWHLKIYLKEKSQMGNNFSVSSKLENGTEKGNPGTKKELKTLMARVANELKPNADYSWGKILRGVVDIGKGLLEGVKNPNLSQFGKPLDSASHAEGMRIMEKLTKDPPVPTPPPLPNKGDYLKY
ncbi:MAG: hypothetical protein UT36_C0003G0022 [Candidatus Peregrinibacteria bacterium GW2011_GWF2_39_17]|nr:MAG: hypothetical protein UT36_C0003G0022 [Candidatus Peregrinibacteria bacterium GW2011_GWF2_39_17]HCW32015.1 hypothetical protein [Candidatus Peregrinibacteria bacterium]